VQTHLFGLVAAGECPCTSVTVTGYQKRISGPLLDRIDCHAEVPRVEYEKFSDTTGRASRRQ